jgi:hypothetical protein
MAGRLSQVNVLLLKDLLPTWGHVISADGVATDPSKISCIQSWPSPTSVKELRSFLGLSEYYRKFVKHYAIISKPLINLLKKSVPFVWTPDTETSFQTLKKALVIAPVLALPDFSLPFCVELMLVEWALEQFCLKMDTHWLMSTNLLVPKLWVYPLMKKSTWLLF